MDAFSRLPKLHGLFNITTTSIMNALHMHATAKYQKNNDLFITERIQSDFGFVFASDAFHKYCLENRFKLTLAAPKHLEMNSILERTFQSLCLIKNSLIVQARVDESFTHFASMHACHIFACIPVKTLRKNERLTTPFELFTESKPKIKKFQVLFCPCVVKKCTVFTKNTNGNFLNHDVQK